MTLSLVLAPDPILRQICAPLNFAEGAWGEVAFEMLRVMYQAKGRGLAAPQVGLNVRLFVMDSQWKSACPIPRVFCNPEIVVASERLVTQEEGCLSLPDQPMPVARPAWVRMRWQDLGGAWHDARFEGFEAACVQHERDHLDGILITDYEAAA
ncbi:peptide deformylase [Primorskyibacter sp. S187A]|uniref:peptide deformylase n=1 Tax=Primorskyibacter sp. S187A TaxID=3415130 RepID=UPI003C7DC77B